MEPIEPDVPTPGSIAGVAARLFLWGRRAPQGLARVEFDSDYSRQQVDARVREACEAAGIPYYALELPRAVPAPDVVTWIKQQLASLPRGVVSITGWATAFPPDVPLIDSLRVLNYNRENLAQFPLCQIWWLTRPLAGTFIREIPDLNSWFIVHLSLDENIVGSKEWYTSQYGSDVSFEAQEAARRRAADLTTRLENAIVMGENASVLVMLAKVIAVTLYNADLAQDAGQQGEILLDNIVDALSTRASHQALEGEDFYRFDTWIRFLESSNFQTATDLANIAFLFECSGRSGEAELFYREALTTAKTFLGLEATQTRIILNELVQSLQSQERYKDAAELYESLIPAMKTETVLDRLLLADEYYLLARLYQGQGKWADAEATYLKALSIQQAEASVTQGSLPLLLDELAKFYRVLGRFAEADMYENRSNAFLAKQSGLKLL